VVFISWTKAYCGLTDWLVGRVPFTKLLRSTQSKVKDEFAAEMDRAKTVYPSVGSTRELRVFAFIRIDITTFNMVVEPDVQLL